MVAIDARALVFYDDHRATDSATITGYMHCLVMVVYVDADELAQSPCSTEATELLNKATGISG